MLFGLFRKPRLAVDPVGEYRQHIIGESHYQRALDRIAGGKNEKGHQLEVTAEIILDERTLYDGRAVRVEIGRKTVGFLPSDDARKYRRWLRNQQASRRVVVECPALITGGWHRSRQDQGYYGVRLDLPPL